MFTKCLAKNQTLKSTLRSRSYNKVAQSSSINNFMQTQRAFAHRQDNFASGANAAYAEQMYEQWRADPQSVHASWNAYFTNLEGGSEQPFQAPPTLGKSGNEAKLDEVIDMLKAGGVSSSGAVADARSMEETAKIMSILRAYMTHGHLMADTDPLGLKDHYAHEPELAAKFHFPTQDLLDLVNYRKYGFSDADLDRTFHVNAMELGGIFTRQKDWKLRDLIGAYEKAYCHKIGVEFMHIPDREICNWIRNNFEGLQFQEMSKEQKSKLFDRLTWTHNWGAFLGSKFNTMKRFGLDGSEAFVPGLKTCIDRLVDLGTEKVVIGMPHRGRLNVLANVVRKPMEIIMAEFQGIKPDEQENAITSGSGDVKYHLGTSFSKKYDNGKVCNVTVLANPSHLETVNPVLQGVCRAEQHFMKDVNREKVVPICLHGDAAMAGQGVVFETLQMQSLRNYTVGGTIHVVVNNQVGFTTTPDKSRSGKYASDVAKAINAPIFHVNGNSMEDVANVFRLAAEYRQKFKKDVVVDVIAYRKMGHNELDQPMFTQPLMYSIVKKMNPVVEIYKKQLIEEGTLTADEAKSYHDNSWGELEKAYQKSKTTRYQAEDWTTPEWEAIKEPTKYGNTQDTGVDLATLKDIGLKITTLPTEEKFHPAVKKIFDARVKAISEGKGIDWGTAEALAFATLIDEGNHVRISGQDVERGTFSHRHAHVWYQDKDGVYVPINAVAKPDTNRDFIASNSHLSEYAVLGFELGYAQTNPNTLTIWEAQFGDFANGAQIMIDTFLVSGEAKWNVNNGLVVLLPHGYDGQGPEHSSARVERFLQLCDSSDEYPTEEMTDSRIMETTNITVANCTTAANYFHLLRTQIRRSFRKPLVVMAPKKLLKFRGANSDIEDFAQGLRFKPVIEDVNKNLVSHNQVRRVILCSGQVYYDLESTRQAQGHNDVAIIRVEQMSPFPFRSVMEETMKYKNADILWAQEEPKNAGGWQFMEPRIRDLIKQSKINRGEVKYAGRPIMAATAGGYAKSHTQELENLLKASFAK